MLHTDCSCLLPHNEVDKKSTRNTVRVKLLVNCLLHSFIKTACQIQNYEHSLHIVAAYYIRYFCKSYCEVTFREGYYKKTQTCLKCPNLNVSISNLKQNAEDNIQQLAVFKGV